jgi:hypothetical protein
VAIFGAGGGEKTAREARIDFLGSIPLDPRVVACGDTGKSYQATYPASPVTQAYETIAGKIGKLV